MYVFVNEKMCADFEQNCAQLLNFFEIAACPLVDKQTPHPLFERHKLTTLDC